MRIEPLPNQDVLRPAMPEMEEPVFPPAEDIPRDLPPPTPEEQAQLMISPEARAGRQALRLALRTLDFQGKPRGRKRADFEGEGRLPFQFADTMPTETVTRLAQVIQPKQPLFDKFTNHHQVRPAKWSIDEYVMAGNKNRKVKLHAVPAGERSLVKNDMRRQTQDIADKLQQAIFDDRNTARLRRYSLRTTRYLISRGLPLDAEAAKLAADAIEDFGQCLQAKSNNWVLRTVRDEDLGVQVVHIGHRAVEDPEILRQNPALLKLVQLEQKARDEFWSPRYEATQEHLGDRLTKQDKQNGADLEAELERLAGLIPE